MTAPANRAHVEIRLAGDEVEVSSRPLKFEPSEDIKADVLLLITRVADELRKNIGTAQLPAMLLAMKNEEIAEAIPKLLPKLLPTVAAAAELLATQRPDGKQNLLKYLAPLVMAETTVVATNDEGQKERFEFWKRAEMARFFDLYPETYFPILWHAGRVTFARFFPVKDLLASRSTTARAPVSG